jgi:uncharacterized membrane protein
LWLAAEGLAPERQQAFRKLLGEARRGVKTETAAGRASREELERLLTQQPLDRAAIEIELEKIRSADAALRARLEEAVVSFAASLSVAERKLLVEGLKDRGRILRRVPPGKN